MQSHPTPPPSTYPVALAFRRYLTTRPHEDLAAAATQLAAELAARNVALAMAKPGEAREAGPAVYYGRDTDFRDTYSELIVSFPDHATLGFFTADLGEPAWDAQLMWLPDEDPPDLVEITRTDDGLPADHDAAREAIRGVCHFPLVLEEIEPLEGEPEGRYATWLPASFPSVQVAHMDAGDWAVEVISRQHQAPRKAGGESS